VDQRNQRYNVWNAAVQAIFLNIVNTYVAVFAVRLGADDLQLGYLNSWPQVASVVAVLFLASAIAQSPHKQAWIAVIQLVSRSAALGAAAVPWFPVAWRVWALILFWVLIVAPNSVGNTAQQSFLADIFPVEERGKVFAARNAWATGAGMITVLLAGWALDHLFSYPQGYQILFFLSFLSGLVEIWLFLRMREPDNWTAAQGGPEPPAATPSRPETGWRTHVAVFRHRPFLAFVCCSIPFHFTWQMAGPIFTRYQVTDLGMNNTWISLVTLANSLSAVIAYPFLARKAQRVGNLRMLAISSMILAMAPVLTALAPSPFWVMVVNLFFGIGVAGVNLFVLNTLLDVSPREGRPVYLSVHAALVCLSAAIAPVVGAHLMAAVTARNALILSSVARFSTSMGFYLLAHRGRLGHRRVHAAA